MDIIFVDCDYRKQPKTSCFCAVCQRDIKNPKYYAYYSDPCEFAHPDNLQGNEIKVIIGNECARHFPDGYLIQD